MIKKQKLNKKKNETRIKSPGNGILALPANVLVLPAIPCNLPVRTICEIPPRSRPCLRPLSFSFLFFFFFFFFSFSSIHSLFLCFNKDEALQESPIDLYLPCFNDVHVMMALGFGLLMTFLCKYYLSSMGSFFFLSFWGPFAD